MAETDRRQHRTGSQIEEVRAFWSREACGERYGDDQERLRYELEPEVERFADFAATAGQRVLEIGVGMGADLVRFAEAGADVVGVDLTERAVAITRERLAREGLPGDIRVADAEALPLEDSQFDLVWSWGVLHHTADTAQAVTEACRVLRPGGVLKVMLYHRRSWFALAAWVRFGVLRGRPLLGLRRAVAHVESPGTKAFTVDEVQAMLARMDAVAVRPCLTHWDRRVAPGISSLFGDRFGWFLLAEARKPLL